MAGIKLLTDKRMIVKLSKMHARLTKQARKPHGLSATQAKILEKISKIQVDPRVLGR